MAGVRMAEPDGVERRGEHDPLDAGVAGGPQHPQRAVPGGHDHLVVVPDLPEVHGEATCSTKSHPSTASAQPVPAVRSAATKLSASPRTMPAPASTARTSPSRASDRTVVRTR
ncbi:hypothetical protein GCM10027610_006620 [Dactylosporangium cerinum]